MATSFLAGMQAGRVASSFPFQKIRRRSTHCVSAAGGPFRASTIYRLTAWMLFLACLTGMVATGHSQDVGQLPEWIEHGEFPLAIRGANQLPPSQRDAWLAKIAQAQYESGSTSGAYHTAEQIIQDTSRSDALNELHGRRFRNGDPTAPVAGAQGGVTLADYNALINLIQNTIQPDSWQDTGQGLGTLQPYPSGVFVSADGTVERIRTDQSREALRLQARAQLDSGNRQITRASPLRMISLTRLEKAAQSRVAQGLPVDEMMQNLGGLYGIEFLTVLPDSGDLVIAGPAGDWKPDAQGRPVNTATGRPVLQLDDLVVCLRNAANDGGKFGCSINPRPDNLARTREFLDANQLQGKRWSSELREALGKQDIEVYGIDPQTHAAGVLVEADYRMKLIGMGLEPSVPEVPSYFDRIAKRDKPDATDVVRWWFTMNYDDLVADANRTVFAFQGTGVQVLSENEFIDQQGQRVHTGQSNNETAGFAKDFTSHFDELADQYPVYRQLKNVFDLALVAGLIERHDLDGQVGWNQSFFVGQPGQSLRYAVRHDRAPQQVDSVMNEMVVKRRTENSTVKQRIVGVSGGISFDASQVIDRTIKDDASGELAAKRQLAIPDGAALIWWWD